MFPFAAPNSPRQSREYLGDVLKTLFNIIIINDVSILL